MKVFYITLTVLLAVFFVCCAVCSVYAQEISINDFSGGLATKPGIFHVKPNQSLDCYNFNFTDNALSIRNGYDRIDTAYDTVRSIYNYTQRNGRKRLLGIVDDSLEGMADMVISEAYEYGIDTADGAVIGFSHIYPKGEMFWGTWKSDAFWSNGRQRPKIIRDTIVRDMIVIAPGEPRVIPLDAGSELSGEYQYVMKIYYKNSYVPHYSSGYVTTPVTAMNERILITNIAPPAHDTTVSGLDTVSVSVTLYRTKANVGTDIKKDTYFYYVWSGSDIPYGALDTFTVIDSIPDDSLGAGSYISYDVNPLTKYGIGSNKAIASFRCGAPTYCSTNYCADSANYIFPRDSGDGGTPIIADSLVPLRVSYICTYIDTLTGFESDSSRSLYINWGSGDTCYTIGVPKAPTGMEHLKRAIYKSYIYMVYSDTMQVRTYVKDTNIIARSKNRVEKEAKEILAEWGLGGRVVEADMPDVLDGTYYMDRPFHIKFKANVPNVFYCDSVITPYFKIAEIDGYTTGIFVDTITFDSTLAGDMFARPTARRHFNQIISHGDRLWGINGSNVAWSYLDTASIWGAWNFIALNPDDGDENTTIIADRDHVQIYKNKSRWVLYQDTDLEYSRKWVVDGIGCIAPKSMAAYNNGHIYLSNYGVVNETGSIYKDKGSDVGVISYPIDNLIDYTPSQLRTAVGFIQDHKYWLSFPEKDTTYIYDFITNGWSIYSYAFSAVSNYDTVQGATINPPTDMIFTLDGGKGIYLVSDTTQTDNGTEIVARWKSGPIARSVRDVQISDIGFWTGTPDSVMTFKLWDSRDSAVIDSREITPDDNHYKIGLKPNGSNYFYIGITNEDDDAAGKVYTDQLEINQIDIYVKPGTAEITH